MKQKVAKLFHETVGVAIAYVRELWYFRYLKDRKDGKYEIVPRPPYISQIANSKVSQIERFYGDIHDHEAMNRFGARSLDEFSYWAWRACGIAGVQMVLMLVLKSKFKKTTMDLVNEGLYQGGYDVKRDIGWYHKALAGLSQKYGLPARLSKFVAVSQIAYEVTRGNAVLASLKSSTGGHLVLIYGFNIKAGKLTSFIAHDPSNYKKSGEGVEMTRSEFSKLFTRRAIVFECKEHIGVQANGL